MDGLILIVIVASSLFAFFESRSFRYRKQDIQGLAAMGPWGWLFACLFLWIIAFPLYLASREKLRAAGLAVADRMVQRS